MPGGDIEVILTPTAGIPLAARTVAVWYWRTNSLTEADLHRLANLLSADEKARCGQFILAHDRRDFTAAHGLLRHVLSRYGSHVPSDWCFEQDLHGKPALIPIQAGNPPLSFNLSHTRGFVACAVGLSTRLGIDVEQVSSRDNVFDVARDYFSHSEIRLLEKLAPDKRDIRFCEIWTLKEAYLKATGSGIAAPIDPFSFSFDELAGIRFTGHKDDTKWQFLLGSPSSDTRLALAIDRGPGESRWRICLYAVPELSGNAERMRIIAAT
jgi:phosphopantetheinyl transferase